MIRNDGPNRPRKGIDNNGPLTGRDIGNSRNKYKYNSNNPNRQQKRCNCHHGIGKYFLYHLFPYTKKVAPFLGQPIPSVNSLYELNSVISIRRCQFVGAFNIALAILRMVRTLNSRKRVTLSSTYCCNVVSCLVFNPHSFKHPSRIT